MVKKNYCVEIGVSQYHKKKFRQLLLDKRAELIGDVVCMENDSIYADRGSMSHSPLHIADLGSDNYERENTLGLMESEMKLLIEVEAALSRLNDGTFGICQGNGEFIHKARLKAIPWARYCVSCATQMEKIHRRTNPERRKYHFASGVDDIDIDNYSNRSVLSNEKER